VDLADALELLELARDAHAHRFDDDAGEWVATLLAHTTDITDAVETLLGADEDDSALELAGSLSSFWQDTGQVERGRQLTADLLARVKPSDALAYGRAQLVLGELAFRQGDQETAVDATGAALGVAEVAGDTHLAARAENNLSRIAFREGDAGLVRHHAERVLELAGDDPHLRTNGVHMLGWGRYTAGDIGGAVEMFEQNVATHRELGNRFGEAMELANIADLLAEDDSQVEAAAEYLVRALAVPGLRGNRYLGPAMVRSAAVIAARRGSYDVALELLGAADALYDQFGLIADPGDEVPHDVMEATIQAVGREQADAACARGATWTLEKALDAAARALG
jgi:tetratricopeptide (TPR) repeat protein